MKYIASIIPKGNLQNGSYHALFASLDDLRVWARATGKAGDHLRIQRNGTSFEETGRVIIID